MLVDIVIGVCNDAVDEVKFTPINDIEQEWNLIFTLLQVCWTTPELIF